MKREELIKSPYWWLAHIQSELYGMMEDYRIKKKLKKKDIAKMLGFSKGYITQVLKGDCDHKLSKLIELSLAFGKVPKLEFIDIEKYILEDKGMLILDTNKPVALSIVYNTNSLREVAANPFESKSLFIDKIPLTLIPPKNAGLQSHLQNN
jgi:transcriptional regulator with XRE-family HTH domain